MIFLLNNEIYSGKALIGLSIIIPCQISTQYLAKNLKNMINKTNFNYLLVENKLFLKTTMLQIWIIKSLSKFEYNKKSVSSMKS